MSLLSLSHPAGRMQPEKTFAGGFGCATKKWQLRGWHGQTRLTVVVSMAPVAQEDTLKLRLGVPPVECFALRRGAAKAMATQDRLWRGGSFALWSQSALEGKRPAEQMVILLDAPIRGRHLMRCLPVPLGTATVLGSHSCGALSPVTARGLYHHVPLAPKR